MNLWQLLQEADVALYQSINTGLGAHWLDGPMLLLRNAKTWIPLYIALLAYFYWRHRAYLLPLLAMSLVCFAITDYGSASILKPFFERPRPCYETDTALVVRAVLPCGGPFGMPSSHATNHWGLATLWFCLIYKLEGRRWYWLFIWAGAVCFAQVYVGVHYPLDTLMGALLGSLAALGVYHLYLRLAQPACERRSHGRFSRTVH